MESELHRHGYAASRSKSASALLAQQSASPYCENVLGNLKTELATYSELLKQERENRSLNEEIIEVLRRISQLSDKARNCTGRNLDILNKLQINLVNRLNIFVKAKSKDLWREYDQLFESLQTSFAKGDPLDQVTSVVQRIVDLQSRIRGLYKQHNMELSKDIARKLEEDYRALRKALKLYEEAEAENIANP